MYSHPRLIKESARWLVQKGRLQEAEEILDHVAKVNHKKLPADLQDKLAHIQVRPRSVIKSREKMKFELYM